MSIKKTFIVLFVAMGCFLTGIVVLMVLLSQAKTDLMNSQNQRYISYQLATELRPSSDDLTRLARTYVLTGDAKYEKMYTDILDIRNGKKPRPENYERIYWDFVAGDGQKPRPDSNVTIALLDLMKKNNFSEKEFKELQQAQANSDGLVKTEVIAMNAVKGNISAEATAMVHPGETHIAFAQRIMHDVQYHKYKAEIMKPLDNFFELLDKRTIGEVNTNLVRSRCTLTC